MTALLAIIPHPDDESYSFGGTIALAAQAGWRCHVVCASRGEGGQRHDGGPPDRQRLGADREAELRRSCEVLGAEVGEVWGLPDGGLLAMQPQQGRVRAAMERLRPEVVLSLGPDGAYGHPDHIAVHRWVLAAWQELAGPRPALLFAAFEPGLFRAQYEKCVASGIMGDPPLLAPSGLGARGWHYEVDVSGVRDVKLASIAAHRSQLPLGDPRLLFPAGIVDALLGVERLIDASGEARPATRRLLRELQDQRRL
jgi:N-acetyl-1-D-myo-inositol-2-amino-2-deoxy-alpha-D-glucopyranoside deacetylase